MDSNTRGVEPGREKALTIRLVTPTGPIPLPSGPPPARPSRAWAVFLVCLYVAATAALAGAIYFVVLA